MQTNRLSQSRTQAGVDAGLREHMNSVYNRMGLGVMITALTAWAVSSSPDLMMLFLGGPQKWIVMLAPIAIIWFGFNPARMSSQQLKLSFLGLSVLYGISFSVIALAFAGADIARAFFVTSIMFVGISIFGYTTKKDLSAIGTFCLMAFLGAFVVSIIGMFFEYSSGFEMLIDIVVVVAMSGMTAWETQSTKEQYNSAYGAEMNSRMAWSSALSLYLSFVIMFSHILRLMSDR
ncbi:MAG: Bax inhibitor-1/YccA family protein [Alphaproteobacteria bacterium]|nr:Bax inhibitor-1/YccA family protein [Alphaproteobacteria bacterium]